MQPYMGAKKSKRGTQSMPKVQKPILEHPKKEKGAVPLRQVYIYYETPPVCRRYFSSCMRSLHETFGLSKIKQIPISNASDLTIPHYSTTPRVILMHETIRTPYNEAITLDGIGLKDSNIVLVHYQHPFQDTPYLLAHEIGHLFGMPHCSSDECIMGVSYDGMKVKYAWQNLSKRRKLSKGMFCADCRSFL